MGDSYFILDDCVLNIYKALNTKRYPNLIMTSFQNDTTVKVILRVKCMKRFHIDEVCCFRYLIFYNANHVSLDEMTRTPRYGEYT